MAVQCPYSINVLYKGDTPPFVLKLVDGAIFGISNQL